MGVEVEQTWDTAVVCLLAVCWTGLSCVSSVSLSTCVCVCVCVCVDSYQWLKQFLWMALKTAAVTTRCHCQSTVCLAAQLMTDACCLCSSACESLTTLHSHYWTQCTCTVCTTTVLRLFFLGPPGWAGARRELLDFMVQGKINRGRHTDHPAGHHSIQTNQCSPPPSSPYTFFRPDALPAAQPTASKHWRQNMHIGRNCSAVISEFTLASLQVVIV